MPVTYIKSAKDCEIEKNDLQSNRTLKHLKDLSFYKFSIGDVLIREDKYAGAWRLKTAPNGLPFKYVYAFENELGVGYIRRMSIKGDVFVEQPTCVVEFDPSETRFQLDPAYADHLMLNPDAEFNFKEDYKQMRKKREAINKHNSSIAENTDTIADVVRFFQKLKAGDQYWHGYGRTSIRKDPMRVLGVHIDTSLPEQSYIEVPATWGGVGNVQKESARYNVKRYFSLTRPQFIDEIL